MKIVKKTSEQSGVPNFQEGASETKNAEKKKELIQNSFGKRLVL